MMRNNEAFIMNHIIGLVKNLLNLMRLKKTLNN